MNRDGDLESEGPIVQHIHREEQSSAGTPLPKWHRRLLDIVPSIRVELIMESRQTREDELEEGDEKAAVGLMSTSVSNHCVVLEHWFTYFTMASKQYTCANEALDTKFKYRCIIIGNIHWNSSLRISGQNCLREVPVQP